MMTNEEYLRSLLEREELSDREISDLQRYREQIEGQLRSMGGSPRFYYGGSYAKRTMIRSAYDLDIVVYWPNDCGYSIKDIYYEVGNILKQVWIFVNPKTVAWEIPINESFHIDVVPGRALDGEFRKANLYRRDRDSTLLTSVHKHIEVVKDSGLTDVIRLIKLWRVRYDVPLKKSLALELITVDGCERMKDKTLEEQLIRALIYLREKIMDLRIIDPANTNNVLCDEIRYDERDLIRQCAIDALNRFCQGGWEQVFE